MSSNGQYIVAAVDNAKLVYSSDGGNTFVQTGLSKNWISVTSSDDGNIVYATSQLLVGVYKSTDNGQSFSLTNAPTTVEYEAIACSSDGRRIILASTYGKTYISEDYGSSWTEQTNGPSTCSNVAISADGLKVYSIQNPGYIQVAPAVVASASPSTTPSALVQAVSASNTPTQTPTPSSTRSVSNSPTSSRTPSNTPSPTVSDSGTPSNTPSASNTPSNTPSASNTPSNTPSVTPSPSFQPWFQFISYATTLDHNFCDPTLTLCIQIYPASLPWCSIYNSSIRNIRLSFAPPFSAAPNVGKTHNWAVIPNATSGRIFGLPKTGSPQSGIANKAGTQVTYSGITSTTWEQFDVVMTSTTAFRMVLTDNGPNIRYSNNSGTSAYSIPVGRNMRAIKMTPVGSKIIVGESNADGKLFISSNNAISFTFLTNAPRGPYKRIVTSDDGNVIYVHIDSASTPLYYSADAGSTFTRILMNSTVNDVECTADGTFLLIHGNDYLYNFNLTTGSLYKDSGAFNNVAGTHLTGAINADGSERLSIGGVGRWFYKFI